MPEEGPRDPLKTGLGRPYYVEVTSQGSAQCLQSHEYEPPLLGRRPQKWTANLPILLTGEVAAG